MPIPIRLAPGRDADHPALAGDPPEMTLAGSSARLLEATATDSRASAVIEAPVLPEPSAGGVGPTDGATSLPNRGGREGGR